MLTSGVEDGKIKFTNKGDVDLVAGIYERAFLDEMAGAKTLYYMQFGWGDEEIKTLATALIYAHDKQVLGSLTELNLEDNWLGAEERKHVAEALKHVAGLTLPDSRIRGSLQP